MPTAPALSPCAGWSKAGMTPPVIPHTTVARLRAEARAILSDPRANAGLRTIASRFLRQWSTP